MLSINFVFYIFFFVCFLYLCKERWVRRRIAWGTRGHDRPEVSRGNVAPRTGRRIGRALVWGRSDCPPGFPRPSVPREQSKAPGSCTPISYTPPAIRIVMSWLVEFSVIVRDVYFLESVINGISRGKKRSWKSWVKEFVLVDLINII